MTPKSTILAHIDKHLPQIKKPAKGCLRHDYLVPAGPYDEQWDWDGFFMALALIRRDPAEATWMKNWALNYIENAERDGRVAGCITYRGYDPRLHQMKPFLAQGIVLASRHLGDYDWYRPHWEMIKQIVGYREAHFWSQKHGLACWYDSMDTGADNIPSVMEFPVRTVIGADLNTFLYLEYKSLAELAEKSGLKQESASYAAKATDIRTNMQKHLWNEEDQIYYNLFTANGKHIRRVCYSSFVPLCARIPEPNQAAATIRRYLLSEEHMRSPHGLRTLSCKDFTYNNLNIIKPHSNWQGPIWIIANYLYLQGMLRYGFENDASQICQSIYRMAAHDIETSGGMHECYDAETGNALAAPDFLSWNILLPWLIG